MIRDGNIVLWDSQYGKYTLAQAIEHIRKQPENEMQYWKARLLPAVAYNGTFSETDSTHLISYSNVTAMDFDHIGTQAYTHNYWTNSTWPVRIVLARIWQGETISAMILTYG